MIMGSQKNLPEVRFQDFDVVWEDELLGNLFFNRKEPGNELIPIYSVTIDRGMVPRDSLERSMGNDAASDDNLLVRTNDLAYNMMRLWQGAIGLAEQNCMISPAYVVLGPYENVCSKFFIYLFERNRSLYLFTSNSYGITSDRLRLYYKDFSRIKFSIPLYPEQQKIASFLATVDCKLAQVKKQRTLLEQYKKGVMQKIFSQETRFKGEQGEEFPEWGSKKLGDIGETYNGLTGKTKENFGQGKPYIQYKQIFDNSKIDISRFEYVEISGNEKQNKVFFGDVFFTVSSETPDEIGMASVLLDTVGELYLNSFCFGYRLHSFELVSPYFARYLFRNEIFRNRIVKLAQGSTRYNMSKVQLMKLDIHLPCLAEQTKIANFLSAIDAKINHCSAQIDKTEQWKRGLLQKMFC